MTMKGNSLFIILHRTCRFWLLAMAGRLCNMCQIFICGGIRCHVDVLACRMCIQVTHVLYTSGCYLCLLGVASTSASHAGGGHGLKGVGSYMPSQHLTAGGFVRCRLPVCGDGPTLWSQGHSSLTRTGDTRHSRTRAMRLHMWQHTHGMTELLMTPPATTSLSRSLSLSATNRHNHDAGSCSGGWSICPRYTKGTMSCACTACTLECTRLGPCVSQHAGS